MKVLVLCDDYWHPARTARAGLAPLAEQDYEFDFIEDANDWSAEQMAAYSVVLFTKSNEVSAADRSNWMTDEVQQIFADYVRRGGGLFAVHSGTAGYAETPVLRALMGGVFLHHPEQCAVTVASCQEHPVTAGFEPFTLQDEHYHVAFDATDAKLLTTSTSEHGMQPACWVRTEGQGRVCVLTPGHNVEVWLHPAYQTLLKNGLQWCAG